MFGFFKSKSLDSYLNETKRVKIHGIKFLIKKLDPMDHLQGLNVIQKIYETYKVGKDAKQSDTISNQIENFNKVKAYCRDIILAGVVSPRLTAKQEDSGILVDEVFRDFSLVQALTKAILDLTYKKKLKLR